MMIEVLIIQNQATPDLVIPILVTLDQAIVLHPGQVHHPQQKVEDPKDNYEI